MPFGNQSAYKVLVFSCMAAHEDCVMRVKKRVEFAGHEAVLFENGDIIWCGQIFPDGLGASLGLIAELYCE